MHAEQPIGILDSGIGGLTVAAAIRQRLPGESILYFGDNEHFPYGEKSVSALNHYVSNICQFLQQQQCKLILFACYTATTAAFATIQQQFANTVLLNNVIDPTIDYIGEHYANQHIGLIGTTQTVSSGCYNARIAALNKNITLHSQATPLLAPLIEEGLAHRHFSDDILQVYLGQPHMQHIRALILGCTHYPILKQRIAHYYRHRVQILDAGDLIAQAIAKQLQEYKLLNPNTAATHRFILSDKNANTANAARVFFAEPITFDYYKIWD